MKLKWVLLMALVFSLCIPTSFAFAYEKKWHDENKLIAHALGAVGGKTETNSKEAFENSWSSGIKVVEADFSITSDGNLVVRHDFDQNSYYVLEQKVIGDTVMNLDRFSREKINYRYTSLTAAQLIQMLNEYPDMYLITDTKNTDKENVIKQITALVTCAKNLEREDVLKRIIVQIYHEDMLSMIKEVYPFENIIFTLYQLQNPDYDKIGAFCKENGIDVVTINYDLIKEDVLKSGNGKSEKVNQITNHGIKVYTHTINRMIDLKMALDAGCSGIYTDTIVPYDLGLIGIPKKTSVQRKVEISGETVLLNTVEIFEKPYVRLRDVAKLLEDTDNSFSAKYNTVDNSIQIQTGKEFTVMGNEMFINVIPQGFTKKSDSPLYIDNVKVNITGYIVDGDLYYNLEEIGESLGVEISKTESGFAMNLLDVDAKEDSKEDVK